MSPGDIAEARSIVGNPRSLPEQVYTAMRLCFFEPPSGHADRFEHLIAPGRALVILADMLSSISKPPVAPPDATARQS